MKQGYFLKVITENKKNEQKLMSFSLNKLTVFL
jgi:hypothetical protein